MLGLALLHLSTFAVLPYHYSFPVAAQGTGSAVGIAAQAVHVSGRSASSVAASWVRWMTMMAMRMAVGAWGEEIPDCLTGRCLYCWLSLGVPQPGHTHKTGK